MSLRPTNPSWPGPHAVTWHRPLLWLAPAVAGSSCGRSRRRDLEPCRGPTQGPAVRAGALIAAAGTGLAFLMTEPTATRLDNVTGIAGSMLS